MPSSHSSGQLTGQRTKVFIITIINHQPIIHNPVMGPIQLVMDTRRQPCCLSLQATVVMEGMAATVDMVAVDMVAADIQTLTINCLRFLSRSIPILRSPATVTIITTRRHPTTTNHILGIWATFCLVRR